MEKKIALVALLAGSLSCHADCSNGQCGDSANYLNGVYAGIGIGGARADISSTRVQDSLAPLSFIFPNYIKENLTQGFGLLSLGFSKTYNSFYFASDVNLKGYASKDHYLPAADYSFDVYFKPGFIFNLFSGASTVIYPLFGVGMTHVTHATRYYQCVGCGINSYVYDRGLDQFFPSYSIGGGVKQSINEYLSISLDVYYNKINDINFIGQTYAPSIGLWNVHSNQIQNSSVQGAVKLEYLFWD